MISLCLAPSCAPGPRHPASRQRPACLRRLPPYAIAVPRKSTGPAPGFKIFSCSLLWRRCVVRVVPGPGVRNSSPAGRSTRLSSTLSSDEASSPKSAPRLPRACLWPASSPGEYAFALPAVSHVEPLTLAAGAGNGARSASKTGPPDWPRGEPFSRRCLQEYERLRPSSTPWHLLFLPVCWTDGSGSSRRCIPGCGSDGLGGPVAPRSAARS